ncbi:MAG: Glu-tRNA(Gln) amidotransferase subunit GatE [Nitrososphaerota archaeon]|nr:Glu-tRNA(Gln) amidotransferase subunit GatE [Nitrososphaerota archaeon]
MSRIRVGLEIHLQLNTQHKLFCNCPDPQAGQGRVEFRRVLRATAGELGTLDPAAEFEMRKNVVIDYVSEEGTSCLVEADEEPPHPLNEEALRTAIITANIFQSDIMDEIHVMRKTVIDGSNTAGFQRTAVVALGGAFGYKGTSVGVQSICLEEDAARLIERTAAGPKYDLDRLGIPLVEIALEPVEMKSEDVQSMAESLGRTLKLTGLFASGLGTIRQDVNVSVGESGIVEVKGVQKLETISKVISYEQGRQLWLVELAEILKQRGVSEKDFEGEPLDITDTLGEGLKGNLRAFCLRAPGFSGLLKRETVKDGRLGKDLADISRFMGFNGVIHSDELPAYNIDEAAMERISAVMNIRDGDAYIILKGEREAAISCLKSLRARLMMALRGPPSETRMAMADGSTRFLRPRPGSSRMYPETDIPTTVVSETMKREFSLQIKDWDQTVKEFMEKYQLSRDLAVNILDSDYLNWFTEAMERYDMPPSIVATTLTEVAIMLRREGLGQLQRDSVFEVFDLLNKGSIGKEAITEILRISLKDGLSVKESIKRLGLTGISTDDLRTIISEELEKLKGMDNKKAYGILMGRVMERVRGKIDGSIVNEEVRRKLGI